jgi:cyclic pyranopterin phosphate synthase
MGVRIQVNEDKNKDDLLDELLERQRKQTILVDSFGRIARKLRISLTDRCNMQCKYCMPQGNVHWFKQDDVLTYDEIIRLVSILAELGIEKIRLTGGEPLLRPKLEDLIISLKRINAIKSVSMTTNGLLLGDKVKRLKEAGLDSVNISLDSFQATRFKEITGIDGLDKVMDSIDAADSAGLKVKINTVIIRGWNEDEIVDFAKFVRTSGHSVRFIEFMPLDGSGMWQPRLVFAKKEMIEVITKNIGKIVPLENHSNNNNIINNQSNSMDIRSADPAMLYRFADGTGIIGFIPSITEPFCASCDRIRLTSDGRLLTCLFEKPGYDLRTMLRDGQSKLDIKRQLIANVKKKPEGVIKIIKASNLKPSLNLMHTIGG